MTVADYLFGVLRDAGACAVFGTTLTDASVLRRAEAAGLRVVSVPGEQAALDAARAFGRASGAPGVALTSDAGAAMDKPSLLLDQPAAAAMVAHDLLAAAATGPVLLTLPAKVARAEYVPAGLELRETPNLPLDAIEEAALLLSLAARPVLWAGAGAVRSQAWAELAAVAELLGAPVLTGVSGKGAISEHHPLAVGAVFEAREAAMLLRDSDAAIAVGTSFSARSTRGGQLPMPLQLFHIDLDPDVVSRRFPARLGITGDARAVLAALAEALEGKHKGNQLVDPAATATAAREGAQARLRAAAGEVAEVIDALRDAIPAEVPTVWDVAPARWAVPLFPVSAPGSFHAPAAGAAPGSSLAGLAGVTASGLPAVAVVTRDEILLRSGDLAGIGRAGLPAVIVVLSGDAWVGDGPKSPVRSVRPTGVGTAFGLTAVSVEGLAGLPEAVSTALAAQRPTLIALS